MYHSLTEISVQTVYSGLYIYIYVCVLCSYNKFKPPFSVTGEYMLLIELYILYIFLVLRIL